MTVAAQFIRDEFFTLTLLGALGRSALWKKEVPESDRKRLHAALKHRLESLSADYRSSVPDAAHLANIRGLADGLSAEFALLFRDGRFRIGLAQKALNLYLKYLWCAGFAAQPPHCPVDAMVLVAAGVRTATPWTRLDSMDEYERLIGRIRAHAGGRPLAEWELEAWSAKKAKLGEVARRPGSQCHAGKNPHDVPR